MKLLKADSRNPRYFSDTEGKLVYLTGSHTWHSLRDIGYTDPPEVFDYDGYLACLRKHNHNFFRLWARELTSHKFFDDPMRYATPFPWRRTGPGTASDGKPCFDLSKFDESYFERLRTRVVKAYEHDIYVAVMLFEGWALQFFRHEHDGCPYTGGNNINGVDDGGGTGAETLEHPEVTKYQDALVRKVIDTVGDLDNVLWEISNEAGGHSIDWQYHMIRLIREFEAGRGKQHPIGMTFPWKGGDNEMLFRSEADWISPGNEVTDGQIDGRKVIIFDTDHTDWHERNPQWVWEAFFRGMNPIVMDHWNFWSQGGIEPSFNSIREAMGHTRLIAERVDLRAMTPQPELSTSGYCLANRGSEYLAYLPNRTSATIDLSAAQETLAVEWMDTGTGCIKAADSIPGGKNVTLSAPFGGPSVVHIMMT